MRANWLLAQQHCCRLEFEFLIAKGEIEAALAIGEVWDRAAAEIDQISQQNEKTYPF